MPVPPAVAITSGQYAQAQSARTELTAMLLSGTSGGGVVPAPFLGLESVPAAALDMYEVIHLALQRLMSAFQAFDNVTAAYPHTSASFDTKGGVLLVMVTASARPTAAPGLFGFDIKVDGNNVGVLEQYGNEAEHDTLTRPLLVTGIAAGAHTLGAALRSNTTADSNDRLSAVVFELPF